MPPPRLRPGFGFTPGLPRKGRPPLRAGRPFLDLPEKFGEGGGPGVIGWGRRRGGVSRSSRSRSKEQGGNWGSRSVRRRGRGSGSERVVMGGHVVCGGGGVMVMPVVMVAVVMADV